MSLRAETEAYNENTEKKQSWMRWLIYDSPFSSNTSSHTINILVSLFQTTRRSRPSPLSQNVGTYCPTMLKLTMGKEEKKITQNIHRYKTYRGKFLRWIVYNSPRLKQIPRILELEKNASKYYECWIEGRRKWNN